MQNEPDSIYNLPSPSNCLFVTPLYYILGKIDVGQNGVKIFVKLHFIFKNSFNMLSLFHFRQIADVGFGRNRKDSHSLKKTINELCIKNETLGQAHHMFLRFLNLQIYKKYSRNFLCFTFVQA